MLRIDLSLQPGEIVPSSAHGAGKSTLNNTSAALSAFSGRSPSTAPNHAREAHRIVHRVIQVPKTGVFPNLSVLETSSSAASARPPRAGAEHGGALGCSPR